MTLRQISKYIDFFLTWVVLRFCTFAIGHLSRRQMYGFARNLGLLFYLCFVKHRRIAFDSLEFALGAKTTLAERRRIAKDCFINMVTSGVEMLYTLRKPRLVRESVAIENLEVLDRELTRGKGVILVSAHFGNFILILGRLSLAGYKTSVIMRPLKDSQPEKIFDKERARLDVETILSIPRKDCVAGAIRALRKNKLLLIPLDQNFGTGGVFVDFFGRKAATATGPVVLAQRTGASIVPCFIIRNKDNTQTIIIEKPLRLENQATEDETIARNIQKLTDLIESYIRRYPAEWSWIHRRWKSRPKLA